MVGVVTHVSAALEPGRITAAGGPNGAGKSVLLSALAGLMPVADGRATIDGGDLAALAPRERARLIGYLPQLVEIAWDLSVRNLVALGGLPHGGPEIGRAHV